MRTQALATGLILAVLTLTGLDARADMLPENHKGIKLSVKVDAKAMPPGKTLLLANTFEGADVLPLGEAVEIHWHPMGGELQLRMIDTATVAKIEPLRANRDRDAIAQLVARDPACGEAIRGVRTIPEQSLAEELRWTLEVTTEGEGCNAELLRIDYLSADGEQVPTPDGAPQGTPPDPAPERKGDPPAGEAPPATAAGDGAAAPAPGTTDPASSPADKAAGCGCRTREAAPVGLGLFGLLLGAALRRRR